MTVPPGFSVIAAAASPRSCTRSPWPSTTAAASGSPRPTPIPSGRPGEEGRDRILIFEDTDRRRHGSTSARSSPKASTWSAAWKSASAACGSAPLPYLLFIPDSDGDDKPDGEPQVLLDGWGYRGHARNAQQRSSGDPTAGSTAATACSRTRKVGKPGTPDDKRIADQRRHLALSSRRGTSSRSSPTARAIPGASTSTSTATASSRPASFRTCSTSFPGAATSGRPASTSTRTPTTTSRRSPTTATTLGDQPHGGNRRQSDDARRRPRPRRLHDLSRRHLAREVSRPDLHEQHPRQPA